MTEALPDFESIEANAFAITAASLGHRVVYFQSRETLYSGPAFFTREPDVWTDRIKRALEGYEITAEHYDSMRGWIVRLRNSAKVRA
jgi:hypothetical protein